MAFFPSSVSASSLFKFVIFSIVIFHGPICKSSDSSIETPTYTVISKMEYKIQIQKEEQKK